MYLKSICSTFNYHLFFFTLDKLASVIRANATKVVYKKGKQFVWLAKSLEIIVGIVDSRDVKH